MTITPDLLRKWLNQQDISIRKLAERCGVNAATISNFLSGKSGISDTNMAKLLMYVRDEAPPSLTLKYLQVQCESGKCKPELIIHHGEELLKRNHELTPSEHADLLILLCEKFIHLRIRLDDMLHYARRALGINSAHIGSPRRWSRASLALAHAYYINGMYSMALDTAGLVKSQLIDIHLMDDMIVRAYSLMAISAAAMGDHIMAKQYSEQSLTYIYTVTTDDRRLRILANDAYVRCDWLIENRQYHDAIETCTEAYHLYTKLNDCHSALAMQNNLAYALAKCGELDKSAAITDLVVKEHHDPITVQYAHHVRLEIALQKGDTVEAKRIARMLADSEDTTIYLRVDCLCKLCDLEPDKARDYITQAIRLVQDKPQMRALYNRAVTHYALRNGLPGPVTDTATGP